MTRPSWQISLPPALEQRFEAETVRDRNRYLGAWLAFALALNILYSILEVSFGAPSGLIVLPHCFFCALLGLGVVILFAQPERWAVSTVVILAHLGDTAVMTWVGIHSPDPFAERVITTAAFMILFVNVTSPLRFSDGVVLSTLAVGVFGAVLFGPFNPRRVPEWDTVVTAAVMAAISLSVLRQRELASRRAFLSGILEKLRVREIVVLSETDALTGLPNRRAFTTVLARQWEISRATGQLLGLLMVDVDHFKILNDVSGHPAGDECLQKLAAVLRRMVRPDDLVARIGGEEFAVVLTDIDFSRACEVGERLRRGVEAAALPHPVDRVVTVSVGSAVVNPCKGSSQDLISGADKALYRAKAAGRNRVELWQSQEAQAGATA